MRKREERRKLGLRREQLRLLAELTGDEMVQVAGGGDGFIVCLLNPNGRGVKSGGC